MKWSLPVFCKSDKSDNINHDLIKTNITECVKAKIATNFFAIFAVENLNYFKTILKKLYC